MMCDSSEEVVTIPKVKYVKLVRGILYQHHKIQQQDWRLKAQQNLSDLLCKKDRELLKLKDTLASVTSTSAGRKLIYVYPAQKKVVASADFSAAFDLPRSAVSADSGHNQVEHKSPDVEEDGALVQPAPYNMPCVNIEEDDARQIGKKGHIICQSAQMKQPADVDHSQHSGQQFTVFHQKTNNSDAAALISASADISSAVTLEKNSSSQQLPRSSSFTQTVAAAKTALPGQFSHVVSKDLLEKVMQQNARLKKAIREILHQKGLSMADYLNKVEYEDVIELLRSDIRRQEAHINRLKSVIASRNSDKLDEIAQSCSLYSSRISELERKIVVLQRYKEQCEERLSQAGSSNEVLEKTKMQDELITTPERESKLAQQIEAAKQETLKLERTVEDLLKRNKKLSDDHASVQEELEKLRLQFESLTIEKQSALDQLTVYKDDFNMERREKCEQKDHYEEALAKHREWIRRLANETQALRSQYEATAQEKSILEEKLRYLQRPVTCSLSESRLPQSVAVDSPRLSQRVSTDGVVTNRGQSIRCPRCEREFDSSEEAKFAEHIKRCSDE